MSGVDLQCLLPLAVLGGGAVLLLVLIAVRRHHALAVWSARLLLLLAGASLWPAARVAPHQVTALLVVDRYTILLWALLLSITLAVSLISPYQPTVMRRDEERPEEFHLLLILACVGGCLLVASSHFGSLALGLETLSVSLFGLIGYSRQQRGVEAAIKYLVLSGASTALLLFGIALVYAAIGTMVLPELAALLSNVASKSRLLQPAGLALIAVGIGFKLGLAPFHMWTADVYQGAPAAVTAFIAAASKTAVFGLLLRFFLSLGANHQPALLLGFSVICGLSMLVGNLLALLQTNVKRLLAYSSIAHLGYLLLAFLAGGRLGLEAAAYYLCAYSVTVVGAFAVISVTPTPRAASLSDDTEAETLSDYTGLYWRRPLLAALFTVCLLSLAGIPLTAGFIGKFYLLAAGLRDAHWILALILVLSSAIGLFYYLRVVVAMFASPTEAGVLARSRLPLSASLVLATLGLLVVVLGVAPGPLQSVIRLAISVPPR